MPKAVIDVGSNSVLLTVAEQHGTDWHTIFETSEVSALGEGTKATGILGETGITNTLAALRRAFDGARNHNAEPRAFGTMALRIASNTSEFLERAKAQGTPVEVIPGELEAELGLASVTEDPHFANNPQIAIIDVGGHSTEIATAKRGQEAYRQSFPIGTLSLRSGTLSAESPAPGDLLRATTEIDEIFQSQEADIRTPNSKLQTLVALGASATNLITIRDRILEWDPAKVHGQTLDLEYTSKFVGSASELNDDHRAALPGIEKGRERTIHIGALLLERALHALHAESCRVSVRGWRYAMLSRF